MHKCGRKRVKYAENQGKSSDCAVFFTKKSEKIFVMP